MASGTPIGAHAPWPCHQGHGLPGLRLIACRAAVAFAAAALLTVPAPGRADTSGTTFSTTADPARASRAISLAPHITELIFAAGAGSHIAATVNSSDHPPAAALIPKIGDGLSINLEKALTLNPDLVIAWQDSGATRTLAPGLAALDIPLIYSQPGKLEDISGQVLRFGEIFATQPTAKPAAAALAQRVRTLRERYADKATVSVFLEVGSSPLYTIGADPLLNHVLETCGGINLFADTRVAAPQINVETLMLRQPDVIITTQATPMRARLRAQAWAALGLGAALNKHVINLDPDQLLRPGPRLIDAAEQLCHELDRARHAH